MVIKFVKYLTMTLKKYNNYIVHPNTEYKCVFPGFKGKTRKIFSGTNGIFDSFSGNLILGRL